MNNTDELEIVIPKKLFLPAYQHLAGCNSDIIFYFGGRDSGKSQDIAQRLIVKCLSAKYFRCILIKKTYSSIEESQYQTIKDVVDRWGLSEHFTFKKQPLTIECANGNRFIARGLDNPQSIKSVKDPTDAWHEEGNQEDLSDFITVTTTLRANKVKIQQWFSFNPECDIDYEEFWLYKTFEGLRYYKNGTYTWIIDTLKGPLEFIYSVVHSTYHNNKYCTGARIAFLEQLKEIDPYYYQVYTLGKWGRRANNSPFFYAFDRSKHLTPTTYDPHHELLLSFDFNRSPITCQAWQYINGRLKGIRAMKLDNSDIYALCDHILSLFPGALYIVTGDATGKNSTALVQNGLNYYTVIKSQLRLAANQIKVPAKNPPLKESQVLSNAVLVKVPIDMDPVNMRPLIYDMEKVRVQADGNIEKKNRTDAAQQADQADCFRYLCDTFFRWVLKT